MPPSVATATAVAFSAPRSALLAMIDRAARVASAKPIPALDSVSLLLREGDAAQWWATDTQLWVGGVLRGVVATSSGPVLLPVSLLKPLLKSLPEGMVSIRSLDNGRLEIAAGSYRGKVATHEPGDFPELPTLPAADAVSFARPALVRALAEALSALNTQTAKFFIRGALFSGDTWTTTDGHRMARARLVPAEAVTPARLVPAEAVTALAAIVSDHASEVVTYAVVDERLVFRLGDDVIITREIDAKFPQTDRVFDQDRSALRAELGREAWITALHRAAATATRSEGMLSCTFAFGKDGLTITTQSPDRGESSETVAVDVEGKPLTFSMNGHYVLKFLTTATSERVCVRAHSALDAVSFEPVGQDGGTYEYIVMPMRL